MTNAKLDRRFWSKVRPAAPFECWEWIAYRSPAGYGRFGLGYKAVEAHRVAWELLRGEIPDGLVVDHLCKNKACVNPWHMELVTTRVNTIRGPVGDINRRRGWAITHCPQGHTYDDQNTYVDPRGYRHCRTCRQARKVLARIHRKTN